MRHKIAMRLFKLAKLITILAHNVDDDLTGKFIYLPAIPEYEVPVERVEVLHRNKSKLNQWVIRNCRYGSIGSHSYEYLKKGKVDLS